MIDGILDLNKINKNYDAKIQLFYDMEDFSLIVDSLNDPKDRMLYLANKINDCSERLLCLMKEYSINSNILYEIKDFNKHIKDINDIVEHKNY